jgi:hypothetical protein
VRVAAKRRVAATTTRTFSARARDDGDARIKVRLDRGRRAARRAIRVDGWAANVEVVAVDRDISRRRGHGAPGGGAAARPPPPRGRRDGAMAMDRCEDDARYYFATTARRERARARRRR